MGFKRLILKHVAPQRGGCVGVLQFVDLQLRDHLLVEVQLLLLPGGHHFHGEVDHHEVSQLGAGLDLALQLLDFVGHGGHVVHVLEHSAQSLLALLQVLQVLLNGQLVLLDV